MKTVTIVPFFFAMLASCSSVGTVVYKDSIVHGPTAFLSKQEVTGWSVSTPDGINVSVASAKQDSTAPVSAYGFVKGIKSVENMVGDGLSNVLTSGGKAIEGDTE